MQLDFRAMATRNAGATRLAQLLEKPGCLVVPGIGDPLSARVAYKSGFETLFLSGFYASSSTLGQPDAGMLGHTDMVQLTARIMEVVPDAVLIVDGDTGYGGPSQVKRAVRAFAQVGAACVMIEDQLQPKQCGHTRGKQIVSFPEAMARVQAAVDAAREEPGTMIMARTDARIQDAEQARARAKAFVEIGADLVFLEAPRNEQEMLDDVTALNPVPQMANMVEYSMTPLLGHQKLEEIGYKIALHPILLLNASIVAMRRWAEELKNGDGRIEETGRKDLMDFEEVQKAVGFHGYFDEVAQYKAVHDKFQQ